MISDFSIFILSHNNPYKCPTLDLLQRYNNTNNYYIVVDNLDKYLVEYEKNYEDKLLVFDKYKYVKKSDTGYRNGYEPLNSALYARLSVEDFAKELDLKYFCLIDDDINSIVIKYPNLNDKTLSVHHIFSIDTLFEIAVKYLISTNSCSVSFAAPNVFIGGYTNFHKIIHRRIQSNIFIRNVSKEFNWKTIWYDDFNSCVLSNKVGRLTLNIPYVKIEPKAQGSTKQSKNRLDKNYFTGMELAYKQSTSFDRSMYCVIVSPNCVKARQLKDGNFWPSVNKNNAWPKIISDRYKK